MPQYVVLAAAFVLVACLVYGFYRAHKFWKNWHTKQFDQVEKELKQSQGVDLGSLTGEQWLSQLANWQAEVEQGIKDSQWLHDVQLLAEQNGHDPGFSWDREKQQ